MIDTLMILLLGGFITFIGYFGLKFFERTKISDLLILLFIGLLLGPIFNLFSDGEIGIVKGIAPFFSTVALIILLFEGGLQLNFFKVLKSLKVSTIFTFIVFSFSVVLVSAVFFAAGWNILECLIVGAILGGTSSAVVIPLIQKTNATEETKTLLTLESSLTDALCVILAISFIEVLQSKIVLGNVFSSIAAAFSIASVIGFAGGITWLVYSKKADRRFLDLLAIASLFLIFALTELLKGNGAVAALVFGIVLGNSLEITKMLKIGEIGLNPELKVNEHELAFFVRTFFFVYLGLIFEIKFLSVTIVLFSVIIVAMLYLARAIGNKILVFLNKNFSNDGNYIKTMIGRGLAAAVLSLLPLSTGVFPLEKATQIIQITFLVIIFSNIITTLGVFSCERKKCENELKPETEMIEKIELQ